MGLCASSSAVRAARPEGLTPVRGYRWHSAWCSGVLPWGAESCEGQGALVLTRASLTFTPWMSDVPNARLRVPLAAVTNVAVEKGFKGRSWTGGRAVVVTFTSDAAEGNGPGGPAAVGFYLWPGDSPEAYATALREAVLSATTAEHSRASLAAAREAAASAAQAKGDAAADAAGSKAGSKAGGKGSSATAALAAAGAAAASGKGEAGTSGSSSKGSAEEPKAATVQSVQNPAAAAKRAAAKADA